MPIDVTCSKCHTRFKVNEKFAGKQGPCPKCKNVITVPALKEQVVVHAPDEFGPKDKTGRSVLKPISRTETKITPVTAIAMGGAIVVVLVVAVVLRKPEGDVSPWILIVGSVFLAPPLAWAGYSFLRDDELDPHRGGSLILRIAICSVIYAILWGLYAYIPGYVFEIDQFELFHLIIFTPPLIALGALTSFLAFELDFTNGLIHYGLYVLVTVGLGLIMGLSFHMGGG